MEDRTARGRSAALVACLLAAALAVCVAPVPSVARSMMPRPQARHGAVTTASSKALIAKLAPTLRTAAASGGASLIDVLVVEKRGSGRPDVMRTALKVGLRADPDSEYWVGRVTAARLAKLVSSRGVTYVANNGRRAAPIIPDSVAPTPAQRAAAAAGSNALLRAATADGVLAAFAERVNTGGTGGAAPGLPSDRFEVGVTHKSSLAWANGFTGTGVRVAVADDSIDFGHPDLNGTQAYNTDPSSPYFGWPLAFDPYSTYLYALDELAGGTNIADGEGWFSSTLDTVNRSSHVWEGHNVVLPAAGKSGVFHIGRLWDENLASARWLGEFPAMLVADDTTAGRYDAVYVDLNGDYDFTNDKRCTKSDPVSYLDYLDSDGNVGTDGIADRSGGMLYWISDGTHLPPFAEQAFPDLAGVQPPAAGALICMIGAYDLDADHGTLCASGVAAQGRIDGASVAGISPPFRTGTGGIVQGGGRDAKLVAISDIYNAYALSTLLAYDFASYGPDGLPGTGDEVQVISNSYGESTTDNDEWDVASRYVTLLNSGDATSTSFLFATGNGGPGYGTNTAPDPSTGIKVGASTQFGADGGWDSIVASEQVTYGDVIPFSDRGPTAMGHLAPTVVADGAYAAGDTALSLADGNGWNAWEIWGGTSRSTPVAAGNLALVYQAFRGEHDRWPTWAEARTLLASGATDLNYDTLVQGAGMVNADRSTRLAAGSASAGVEASPTAWYPGAFRGTQPLAFQQVLHAGDTAESALTITNPGSVAEPVTATDSWLQRTGSTIVTVTLDPSKESAYDTSRPDWLLDVSGMVPAGTDLLVARATFPFAEFTSNGADPINAVRLLAYDWTDRNGDGNLWTDVNSNGFVGGTGEIDSGEYMRFSYTLAKGTSLEARVQEPLGRSHSGVFIGLQHQIRAGQPVHVRIELSYWKRADMPWLGLSTSSLTVAPHSSSTATMRCTVPADAPLGTYEGEYRLSAVGTTTVVPVVITVAGRGANITYGGPSPIEQLMDGSHVFGFQDWDWRAESGDWRFFATDVPASGLGTDALLIAHTSWETTPTDIDTLLYGPAPADPDRDTAVTGPYDLQFTGGSPNHNTGAGVWTFDTATGQADDWVTGPLSEGLNAVLLHDVVFSGTQTSELFSGQTGVLRSSATSFSHTDTVTARSEAVSLSATLDLPGFYAIGYGLSPVWRSHPSVTQGQDWTYEFDVAHAGSVEASITNASSDLDLYLEKWNGSGWDTLAASETPSGNEYVKVLVPSDGHYRLDVYGYDVRGGSDTFGVRLAVPQGDGVHVTTPPAGVIPAGSTIPIGATYEADWTTLDQRDNELVGAIGCGPTALASSLQIPISLRYPLSVEEMNVTAGAPDAPAATVVDVRFSRRIDVSTLDAATFHLSRGGTPVSGDISYDDLTATAHLTADLEGGAEYTLTVTDGVTTPDGTGFGGFDATFTTLDQVPTSVSLALGASSLRYGSATSFTVTARSGASDGSGALEAGAPVALQFQPSGSQIWTTVQTGVTDAGGAWTGTVTGTAPGSYRARRSATATVAASFSTPARTLSVSFAPTLSASVTRVRHGRSIRISVRVRPAAQAAHRRVRVEVYSHGHWVLSRHVTLNGSGNATIYERRSSKGARKIRLRLTGGKGFGTGTSSSLTLRWY